jgi:hypothetical protein
VVYVQGRKPVAALAVACLALLALALAASSGAATRRPPSCHPRRAHAVVQDGKVRVYSVKVTKPIEREVTYACLLRTGKRLPLTEPNDGQFPGSVGHVTLAGPIAGFTYSTHGIDTGTTDIVLVDVAGRRTLLKLPGVGSFIDACVIRFSEVEDLVVSELGSVAWIARMGSGCQTKTFQVHSALVGGVPTLLEEALEIAPDSLSLLNHRLTWENAHQPRSAYLP